MVDMRAAYECILYEKIKQEKEKEEIVTQSLLVSHPSLIKADDIEKLIRDVLAGLIVHVGLLCAWKN
ncbi:hypothetical protein [Coxiella-like endosymbiont]|uniref:hypothetical protein n=1 Tax=Coxiella-like endosymbiont TaxID=1592897 RepID=UPI0034E1ACDF